MKEKKIVEHPDCDHYKPFGNLQAYAMDVCANVCNENVPYSCRRAQQEGLCRSEKYATV